MHNIYVTLSCLYVSQIWIHNFTRFCYSKTHGKANLKNELLKIATYTSKHNITNGKQKHWPLKSCNQKKGHLIMINNDLDDDIIDNNVINYWHKEL